MNKPVIPMKPVKSSAVLAVGYDAESKTLAVTFSGGRTHEYSGISQEQADGISAAKSVGSYVNQIIRGTPPKQPSAGQQDQRRRTPSPVRTRAGR